MTNSPDSPFPVIDVSIRKREWEHLSREEKAMAFPGKFYREGTALKQENVSGNPRILFVEQFGFNHFLNDRIFDWIDILADNGVNGMRVFGFWPFAKGLEEEPFARVGNTYDLNRFNERFFDYLGRWIAYADENGIAVLYELFDSAGFWYAPAAPHNPFYQLVRRSGACQTQRAGRGPAGRDRGSGRDKQCSHSRSSGPGDPDKC